MKFTRYFRIAIAAVAVAWSGVAQADPIQLKGDASSAEATFNVKKAAVAIEPVVTGDKVVGGEVCVSFTVPTDIDGNIYVDIDGESVIGFVIDEGKCEIPGTYCAGEHTAIVSLTNDTNYEDASGTNTFEIASVPVDYWDPMGGTNAEHEVKAFYTGEEALTSGWYVVTNSVTVDSRIRIDGDVNLVLADGATLTAESGIDVAQGNSLTVWAQSAGGNQGALVATGGQGQAGIGGSNSNSGAITINGGAVTATGGNRGAGIDGEITITGGTVAAVADEGNLAIRYVYLDLPCMKLYDSQANMDADVPVAVEERAKCLNSSWVGLKVCDPHDFDGGTSCKWCGASKPPVVSNVVARQRWPWNGYVDVDYEIDGYIGGISVEISFAEQGGQGRVWTATNFLAGAKPSLNPGRNRATWDSETAGATNVVAEVTATVKLVGSGNEKGLSLVAKSLIVTPVDPATNPSCVEVNGKSYVLSDDPQGADIDSRFGCFANVGEVIGMALDAEKVKKYLGNIEYLRLIPSEGVKLVDPTTGNKLDRLDVNEDGTVTFFVTADQVVQGGSIRVKGNRMVVIENVNFFDPVSDSGVAVVASSAVSELTRLDTREGPLESTGTETVTYSSLWHGTADSTVTIMENGSSLSDAQGLAGESNYVWRATAAGTNVLMHVTNGSADDAETAIFVVPPPAVSNVVARQRWPWNGLVDVDYEIGGYTAGLKVEIDFDEQGGRHWTATNFLAGAEPTLRPGRNRATWDAKTQGVTNVTATVTATVKLVKE